jgi:competence protein ComEA
VLSRADSTRAEGASVGDLLRPPPPRSWRERLAARWAAVTWSRLAAAGASVLLVSATSWWLLRPGRLPVESSLPRAAAGTTAPSGSAAPRESGPTTTSAALVVQAAGAVVRPGVYRLPPGARVADLVAAAGGPAPDADLDRTPLAARLVDGQRVTVPRVGQATPAAGDAEPGPAADGAPGSAPLDLNAATVAELDTLPGVGPATAAAIVAYRDRHGRFGSVDELTEVPGIGPAKLAALRDLVRT